MPIRLPAHRPPTHPGVMLREEFMQPLGLTQRAVADALGLSCRRVNKIVHGQGPVTPGIACRLAKYTGTTPDFWVNGQLHWDLYHALRAEAAALERIQPLEWADVPEVAELAAAPAESETGKEAAAD